MAGDELIELKALEVKVEQAKEIDTVEALSVSNSRGDMITESMGIGVMIGRIQALQGQAKMSSAVSLATIKKIKDTKEYKHLRGMKVPTVGGFKVLTGTWDEFCSLVGSSKSTIHEQLNNLEAFGEDALNAMKSLGMSTRDLRQLKSLPDESVKAIVDGAEIKVANKDEAIELIEEMAVKHRKEKQTLQKEVATLSQEKQSTDRLLADKDKKINELSKQLDTPLTSVQRLEKEEDLNKQLLNELNLASLAVDSGTARLSDAVQTIRNNKRPTDIDTACEDALFRCLDRFLSISTNMGILSHVTTHIEQWHDENTAFLGGDE